MSQTNKPRLPRAKRVAETERPNMVLTDRDCDILKLVNDCRILRGSHIETLFFQSRSTAQFRLSRLFHHELLERHFLSVVSGGPASSPALYSLGKRGANILINRFGYERSDIHVLKREAIGWHTLEHVMMINDLRIAVMQACRKEEINLIEWREENTFRAKPDYVDIKDKRGRLHKKPVLPDSYFCLDTQKGKARFFLELDRGTEVLSKVVPQFEVYEAYTSSGQYQERFQAKSLRILVVTTSTKRMENLKTLARKVKGDRKYWFTTFDQIKPDSILTEPIWQQLGSVELHPLISAEE